MQQDKDILGRGKNSYKGLELEHARRILWVKQNEQE